MSFVVDSRIEETSVWLIDWSLSRLYLKKEANFPWVILVPRVENVQELYQLAVNQRHILTEEIAAVSKIMEEYFHPEKINIAALGNIVSQLHIHVVARFTHDQAWPHSVWQPEITSSTYPEEVLTKHVNALTQRCKVFQ